jgi:transcriptional regulator with XRE-family HTH domain
MEKTEARAGGSIVNNPKYLLSVIKELDPEKGKSVEGALQASHFKLVLNQFRRQDNPHMGILICRIIEKHFGLPMQFIGNIAYDDLVHHAVCQKVPFLDKYAHTQTAADLEKSWHHILVTGRTGMGFNLAEALEKVEGIDTINGEVGPMRPLLELTHYELLDLSPGAVPFEIHQAYKKALEVYREDAMVSYSLFSAADREKILARLGEAFSILINERTRAAYDRLLVQQGALKGEAQPWAVKRTPIPPEAAIPQAAENLAVKAVLSQKDLTGMDLRRLRTHLGVSLEQIAKQTMIRSSLLRCIEEDRYDQLPSRFHLKSFLKAYAQYLHLDPEFVVKGYMKRINVTDSNPCLSQNFLWDVSKRSVEFLKRIRIFGGQGGIKMGHGIKINRIE